MKRILTHIALGLFLLVLALFVPLREIYRFLIIPGTWLTIYGLTWLIFKFNHPEAYKYLAELVDQNFKGKNYLKASQKSAISMIMFWMVFLSMMILTILIFKV